ncbi:MAG: 30S ribosome-binding factor RbfA [Pseudomonadota bacterium]
MARDYARSSRVGGQIHRILNELLRFESKDPRLNGVSVTNVDLSRDLSVARVYFSMLDPDADPAEALEGLQRSSGFLRSKLGREMKVRHIPELRFSHDDSVARGFHLSALIAESDGVKTSSATAADDAATDDEDAG